jgi:hypothetical protein
MSQIGEPIREIDIEPVTLPDRVPRETPAPIEPVEAPDLVPA